MRPWIISFAFIQMILISTQLSIRSRNVGEAWKHYLTVKVLLGRILGLNATEDPSQVRTAKNLIFKKKRVVVQCVYCKMYLA